jgi:hypothetical protein
MANKLYFFNFETRRLFLTLLSPLIVHFHIPLPVVLIGLVRRDLLYMFLPIVVAVALVSDKINYGPVTLHPTTYFAISAVILFAGIFISALFLTERVEVWKILATALVLISILHSLTPVVGVNPYGSGGSGCKEIVIDFLDSETVYCIRSTSVPLSPMNDEERIMYYHITVFPLKSKGMMVTGVHMFSPKIVINEFEEVSFTGNGIYHAVFYARNIHKSVMKFCYYPETIIGTIPVPLCESKIELVGWSELK